MGNRLKKLVALLLILPSLLLAAYSGKVIDLKISKPISHAIISDSKQSVRSDENGSFKINTSEKSLNIKAYGYRPYRFTVNSEKKTHKLEPIHIKALYLTFWGASINSKTMAKVMKLIDESHANALVVDVKNEYGSTSFKTGFDQANSYGAWHNRTIKDIDAFMKVMKEKNIYTIARIVTFKDELQATNNEDYAIRNSKGLIWRNHDNMAWVDPFDKRSHNYVLEIAEEAAKAGFDEINFDYIRFPAKDNLNLKKESTQENRTNAIEVFLKSAQDKLRPYGVFISVDTYGNICWAEDDTGIGQTIASLAKYADYLAPMLYPSGFACGSFGFKYPSEHPHAVLYRSVVHISDIVEPKRVRPWLQYFKDYAHKKREYKKFELQEQIRACKDAKTSGWMVWAPSSKYFIEHFRE